MQMISLDMSDILRGLDMSKGEKEGETPSPPEKQKKDELGEERPAVPPYGEEEAKDPQQAEKDAPPQRLEDSPKKEDPDPEREHSDNKVIPPVKEDMPDRKGSKGDGDGAVTDPKVADEPQDPETVVEPSSSDEPVDKPKDDKEKPSGAGDVGTPPKDRADEEKTEGEKPTPDPEKPKEGKRSKGKEGKGVDERVIDVKMPRNIFPARLKQIPDGSGFPTREEILKSLLEKHERLQDEYSKELKTGHVVPAELTKEKEDQKKLRDELNEEVSSLKILRGELKSVNKRLRRELFDLMQKEERLKSRESDVKMYSKFCEDTEWKLETEAIDLETERRLLNDLRSTMDKMRAILDGLTPDEMSEKLVTLDKQITENSIKIEESHRNMLGKVEGANKNHDRYLEASGKIKEMEGRRSWLKRRIELHKEMGKFWRSQEGAALDLDKKDASRKLRDIKEALERTMSTRDRSGGAKEGDGKKGGSRKSGNRDRKGRGRKPASDEGSDKRDEAKPTKVKEDKPKPAETKEDKPKPTATKEDKAKPTETKEEEARPKPTEAKEDKLKPTGTDEKTGGGS